MSLYKATDLIPLAKYTQGEPDVKKVEKYRKVIRKHGTDFTVKTAKPLKESLAINEALRKDRENIEIGE
jgi:hypothetical protein